jgi:hypothetical protein
LTRYEDVKDSQATDRVGGEKTGASMRTGGHEKVLFVFFEENTGIDRQYGPEKFGRRGL